MKYEKYEEFQKFIYELNECNKHSNVGTFDDEYGEHYKCVKCVYYHSHYYYLKKVLEWALLNEVQIVKVHRGTQETTLLFREEK